MSATQSLSTTTMKELTSKLPWEIQNIILSFLPVFLPFSLDAHHRGWRRFDFGPDMNPIPPTFRLCGPPVIVRDLNVYSTLEQTNKNISFDFEIPEGAERLIELLNRGVLAGVRVDWVAACHSNELRLVELEKSDFVDFPDSAFRYLRSNLVSLVIMYSDIDELPSSVYDLTGLRELFVLDNDRSVTISDKIGQLTSLVELSLDLYQIPLQINKLKNLKYLSIDGPNLTNIPRLDLPELVRFTLRDTQLAGPVPAWLFSLPKLKTLDLIGNYFDGFEAPEEDSEMAELDYLSVQRNCFTDLPLTFGVFPDATEININDNEIEEIPKDIQYTKRLKRLTMLGNPLRVIPNSIIILEERTEFVFENNYDGDIFCLCEHDKHILRRCYPYI